MTIMQYHLRKAKSANEDNYNIKLSVLLIECSYIFALAVSHMWQL